MDITTDGVVRFVENKEREKQGRESDRESACSCLVGKEGYSVRTCLLLYA